MSAKVEAALLWLQVLLESRNIEYQIVGGFAATIHGDSREMANIDLYIARSNIEAVFRLALKLKYVAVYNSRAMSAIWLRSHTLAGS